MKRIALMLAAVGLGSGCVITSAPTCNPGDLQVNWAFVDVAGFSNLACNDPGLSATITDVDVYVDDVLEASMLSCTNYGFLVPTLAAGWHNVRIEGFKGPLQTDIIARAFFSLEVCGDTVVDAQAGEGEIEFLPALCTAVSGSNIGYLRYKLTDMTPPTPYVISSFTTTGPTTAFPCASGVFFPVPYGNYRLDWMEEREGDGTMLYSKCSPTSRSVWGPGTSSASVSMNGTTACPP